MVVHFKLHTSNAVSQENDPPTVCWSPALQFSLSKHMKTFYSRMRLLGSRTASDQEISRNYSLETIPLPSTLPASASSLFMILTFI